MTRKRIYPNDVKWIVQNHTMGHRYGDSSCAYPAIAGINHLQSRMLDVCCETYKEYEGAKNLSFARTGADRPFCRFNSDDGCHCAVGRCLLPELQECGEAIEDQFGPGGVVDIDVALQEGKHSNPLFEGKRRFDDLLKPEYRGFPRRFWHTLQHHHDWYVLDPARHNALQDMANIMEEVVNLSSSM